MMVYQHIADAIKAPKIIKLENDLYVARFECMKVYSTLRAIETLLKRGTVEPGDTLIDSSSGIYAYALALACHKFGLKCRIIASKTVDDNLKIQLHHLGAIVEPAKKAANLKMDQKNRVERIQELLQENPNYHWMQQYHDIIHYDGYQEFAELIQQSLNCQKLTLIGGVGSGCSTGGTAQHLSKLGTDVKLVGIQPFGSVTFGSEHIHDPDIIIAGIGSSIEFKNVNHSLYDDIHWLSFKYSQTGSVELLKRHGIFAGLSTGSAFCVALWERQTAPKTPCIFIAPDMGYRYLYDVFAHESAHNFEEILPTKVNSTKELRAPWCYMSWPKDQSGQQIGVQKSA